jgi:hypothetical protein
MGRKFGLSLGRIALKGIGLAVGLVLLASAPAQNGTVLLQSFPAISIADGRSTLIITAEVRDQSGRLAPDGTQVLFETTLGEFRENIVPTVNGMARATMIAGSVPGTARITATVTAIRAAGTFEVEFVSDRALLSTALEYIEVYGPKGLMYSPEMQVIAAAAPNKGVHVRYRDIEINADDLQVKVPQYEVRAKRARLKLGRLTQDFDELFFKLNTRSGVGTTQYRDRVYSIWPYGPYFRMRSEERTMHGVVDVRSSGITPVKGFRQPSAFKLTDISESYTLIAAKKATAHPTRQIQFHRADVYVAGTKLMKLPLFQLSTHSTSKLITDQFFNITQNQLAVNYPYYLTLRPGETSLLRLRSGTRYGRGAGASLGTFLDYELKWNQGDESEGGLTVSGLARGDWGVSVRHMLRPDTRTSISAQLDFPAHRSVFGSAMWSRQFDGFTTALSANLGRSLAGNEFQTQQVFLTADRDPVKLGKTPLRFVYGVTASHQRFRGSYTSTNQDYVAPRARLQLAPQRLDARNTVAASLHVSKPFGRNVPSGLAVLGNLTWSSTPTRDLALNATYEYNQDGFNELFLGRHRVRTQAGFGAGRTRLSLEGSQSLDIDRLYVAGDLEYRVSDLWRLHGYYAFDRYRGTLFQDYSIIVGYRLGLREIGLSWSARTKRIGIEILGTVFY